MKEIVLKILTTISVLLATYANSQSTNDIYLPVNARRTSYQTEKQIEDLNRLNRASAIESGECNSAELDPNGHWGLVVAGFQLSLRCKTNVFIIGEPVSVAVILRNTTSNNCSIVETDGAPDFSVLDESEKQIWPTIWPGVSSTQLTDIPAKHQIKMSYDLNKDNFGKKFLKIGTYRISTKQQVLYRPVDSGLTNCAHVSVCSDICVIKIVSP